MLLVLALRDGKDVGLSVPGDIAWGVGEGRRQRGMGTAPCLRRSVFNHRIHHVPSHGYSTLGPRADIRAQGVGTAPTPGAPLDIRGSRLRLTMPK